MTTADREQHHARPSVVVVGGGYGGTAAARALDEQADVVLVDPKDAFMHCVGALRAVTDPDWTSRIFFSYDGLLTRGRVVRDHATRVEPGRVVLGSGDELLADFVVLATGSRYPFPAKSDVDDTAAAVSKYQAVHKVVAAADRVLLVGAGPVGIELAGEIVHTWTDKQVTLLDVLPEVMGPLYRDDLKATLREQLEERGVRLVLGSPLVAPPPTAPGEAGSFEVTTEAGTTIAADVWFQCWGVQPVSDYLAGNLTAARLPDGSIDVTPEMRVVGQERVFALGDVSHRDSKQASSANRQADVVAANILALADGRELAVYEPTGPTMIVPIGPYGGAGQLPGPRRAHGSRRGLAGQRPSPANRLLRRPLRNRAATRRPGVGTMIIVAGWVDVAPEARSRFLSERRDKILETRAEPGCVTYALSADAIDPRRVRFFECWEDQAAVDARQQRKAPTPPNWVKAIAREINSYEVTSTVPAA